MLKQITSEYYQAIFNLPWMVAQDEGLFAQEGIEVRFVKGRERDFGLRPPTDPGSVESFWIHESFEQGDVQTFSACEWGQLRRSQDSSIGGRIVMQRPAVVSQAMFTRPDSPITDPKDLRNKTIAVHFHAGSHYLALQALEGFMARDEIKVVHIGLGKSRYEALMEGRVDAAVLMEPFITLAEKAGCHPILEAFLNGSEICSPEVDQETVGGINRALTEAVRRINADKKRYVHYLIEDLPAGMGPLAPEDFRPARICCVPPRPYPPEDFERTSAWMLSWGLLSASACFEDLVDNRIGVST